MHISSLSSPYGIGSMGKSAREFVDFLHDAGQKMWQILPVCPTSYGDSPYQSFSAFAGNPYFIDLDELMEQGLLKKEEYQNIKWETEPGKVDYGLLYDNRYSVLKKAAVRFLEKEDSSYFEFCMKNQGWLDEYALFMTLKNEHQGLAWMNWPDCYRNRDEKSLEEFSKAHKEEIDFWKVVQFLFFWQWNGLRTYANKNGISIIGDMPIYVSMDSVDVWAGTHLFQLDENLCPIEVSGCPPDGFSADGQLWGNPLFDWEKMEKDDFNWWVERIRYQCEVYNILRIDHFRGFDSYFAIPYGDTTAKRGKWKQGPGMKLFKVVERELGKKNIIAEDLGFLTDSVKNLLSESGFPGMKVLELAFDQRDETGTDYLLHNFIPYCVAYTGTHDNDTIQGWMQSAAIEDVAYAIDYMGLHDSKNYHWEMMKVLWSSVAETTIVQAQDLFGLGSEARMNTPSTDRGNWTWRILPGAFTKELAKKMKYYMKLYDR